MFGATYFTPIFWNYGLSGWNRPPPPILALRAAIAHAYQCGHFPLFSSQLHGLTSLFWIRWLQRRIFSRCFAQLHELQLNRVSALGAFKPYPKNMLSHCFFLLLQDILSIRTLARGWCVFNHLSLCLLLIPRRFFYAFFLPYLFLFLCISFLVMVNVKTCFFFSFFFCILLC